MELSGSRSGSHPSPLSGALSPFGSPAFPPLPDLARRKSNYPPGGECSGEAVKMRQKIKQPYI